jgi:hypothetical protein
MFRRVTAVANRPYVGASGAFQGSVAGRHYRILRESIIGRHRLRTVQDLRERFVGAERLERPCRWELRVAVGETGAGFGECAGVDKQPPFAQSLPMLIQSWSWKAILGLWIAGAILEALLLAPGIAKRRRILAVADSISTAAATTHRRTEDSVRSLPPEEQLAFRARQDSLQQVALKGLETIGKGLASPGVFVLLLVGGLFVVALYGAIPLILVILTVVWARGRRGGGGPGQPVAA